MSHWRNKLALLACLLPAVVVAQEPDAGPTSPLARPYLYGSFVRVGGGITTPLFPSGSMHDWARGWQTAVSWESTGSSRGGDVSRVAVGFAGDFGRFPLDQAQFIANYPSGGARPTAATAPDATLIDVQATARINIPAPVVTPSVLFALGYYNFHPSNVTFQSPDSTGVARYRSRSGASVAIGFGLDRQLAGPAGVFVEGTYLLGATRFGFVAANSRCGTSSCDIFNNTYIGALRSGLRFRVGR